MSAQETRAMVMTRRLLVGGPRLGVILPLLLFSSLLEATQTQCLWNPVQFQPKACSLPVDDDVPNGTWPHWTHKPFCVVPQSAGTKDKFCVFSSSSFNENNGLSIIARPDTAASILDAVQNPLPAWHARRFLQDTALDIKERLPYAVRSMPGKGRGIVATRHIKQAEIIMIGNPALIADNLFFPGDDGSQTPREGSAMFQRALEQLTKAERVLSLARSMPRDDIHVLDNIFRTNSFGINIEGRSCKGLYPEIAKLNHGCDPNAVSRFDANTLAIRVLALRDIVPGEEILLSYVPMGLPFDRRARALSKWGFKCACALCTSSPSALRVSDNNRKRIVETIYLISQKPPYSELLSLTEEFIALAEGERLITKLPEYYRSLMRLYFEYGDIDSAIRFAKKALVLQEMFDNPEGESIARLRRNIEELIAMRQKS